MLQLKSVDWRSIRNAQREETRAAAKAALEADIPEDEMTPSAKPRPKVKTDDLFAVLGIESGRTGTPEPSFRELSGVVENWEVPLGSPVRSVSDTTRQIQWQDAEVSCADGLHTVDVGVKYLQPVQANMKSWMKQCTCLRWGHKDDGLAAGYFDGYVRVYSGQKGEQEQIMEVNLGCMKEKGTKDAGLGWHFEDTPESELAVIQMRWRPRDRFLAASTTSGLLALLEVQSTTNPNPKIRCAEGTIVDDEFLGLDWACDGSRIVAGGRQKKLVVFDWELKPVSEHGATEDASSLSVAGHQARVVALRAHKKDPNVFISAGMDQQTLVWDIRQQGAVGHFTGPYVTGDAIDTANDGSAILTGSQRDNDQVELWDMRTLGKRWFTSGARAVGEDGSAAGTTPVTCGFSKDQSNRFIFSAGASNNAAKVNATPALPNDGVPAFGEDMPPLGEVAEFRGPPCAFTCLDSSLSGWRAAFGSIDGTVSIIDLKRRR
jgi:WD40 repeat protein